MKDELKWLVGASAEDTQYYAKRATDIAVLKEALDIVKGSGQKTKTRYIESRIRKLEKQGDVESHLRSCGCDE